MAARRMTCLPAPISKLRARQVPRPQVLMATELNSPRNPDCGAPRQCRAARTNRTTSPSEQRFFERNKSTTCRFDTRSVDLAVARRPAPEQTALVQPRGRPTPLSTDELCPPPRSSSTRLPCPNQVSESSTGVPHYACSGAICPRRRARHLLSGTPLR